MNANELIFTAGGEWNSQMERTLGVEWVNEASQPASEWNAWIHWVAAKWTNAWNGLYGCVIRHSLNEFEITFVAAGIILLNEIYVN